MKDWFGYIYVLGFLLVWLTLFKKGQKKRKERKNIMRKWRKKQFHHFFLVLHSLLPQNLYFEGDYDFIKLSREYPSLQ